MKVLELPDTAKDVNDLPVDIIKEKQFTYRELSPKFTLM